MNMKINLLPQEYRPKAAVNALRLFFMIFFVVSIFGMGVWLTGEWFALKQLDVQLAETNQDLNIYGQQYQNVQMIEKEQADIIRKKQDIINIMQPFIPFEEVMGEIAAPVPEKLWLNSVEINSDNTINLVGKTDRINAIALYMMDLEASPALMGTKLSTIENKNNGNADIFEFKMNFMVDKAGLKK
jgi:Tfp pilus assembly protein PilN